MRNSHLSDKNKYTSNIAQMIESSGNFLNGAKQPLFIISIIILIGAGYLLYSNMGSSTLLISNDLISLSENIRKLNDKFDKTNDKMNQINDTLKDQNVILSNILRYLKLNNKNNED